MTAEIDTVELDTVPETSNEISDPNYFLNAPEIVGWSTVEEQELLFNILTSQTESTQTILDVGCGRADLFGFLKNKFEDQDILYKGIDYNPNIISAAILKYPEVDVQPIDLLDFETETNYDWVVGNGLFNIAEQEADKLVHYAEDCVKSMYEKATVGVAINFNTGKYEEQDPSLISWDSGSWLKYLIHTYGKVICRADYLQTDVTFFIFK
jgi:2-polyprenyl-3-methyl-5-hydroxy-6-metoxy-1,4-benzoquinol methylase